VAARFVRRPWVRPLLETSAGVIALGRGPDADAAVAGAIDALRAGLPVVMAPEGGVARAGLRRGRAGVVRIATGGGVPVLPMGWWGQDRLWNEWRHLRRPRVRIVFGPPLRLAPDDPPEMAAELVMRAIASLLPDAYRGDYRPA
jgi:1-acyl-sn-glycerol-3-phosphate acyltransferase